MKVKDLFERQKTLKGTIQLPVYTTKLNYKGVEIVGHFLCYGTSITSLKGAPSKVSGNFYCDQTNITSLEGAPSYVGGNFHCYDTKITSLHNVHKHVKFIGGKFLLPVTIKSNIMGVMLIRGLKIIEFPISNGYQIHVEPIINKHLQGDRDIHACQEELLEAGYGDYAKL